MRVEISADLIRFPPLCACCGAPPQTNMPVWARRSPDEQQGVNFPYCNACAWHVHEWPSGDWGCGVTLLVLMTCGLFYFVHARQVEADQARARSMCGPNCAAPWRCVSFTRWRGHVKTFEIQSHGYAIALMRANRDRLVNVDWSMQHYLDE